MISRPIEKLVPRHFYLKSIKVLDDYIGPYIERTLALDEYELDKLSKSDTSFTFLHALASYTRDPKVIRDQLMYVLCCCSSVCDIINTNQRNRAVFLAGRDTTAATLSWCLYELAHYPATYAKLRNEVIQVVGPDKEPTYDDLKNMRYLQHTLNEALRLYPAVPFNVRYALTDTSLPSAVPGVPDVSVVAGDAVFYSTLSMQRRPELYPPPSPEFADPALFSPDRWDHWQPKAWAYVPFNGGPRICVGQNFALTEMAYVLVRLLQKYERVEYRGDWHAQFHKVEIVGTPGHGVPIAMWKAKRDEVKA